MPIKKLLFPTFRRGLNKDDPPHLIGDDELAEANNIVFRRGIWKSRDGYILPFSNKPPFLQVIELQDRVNSTGTYSLYCATPDGILQLSGTSWTTRLDLPATRDVKNKWFFTEFDNAIFACNGLDNIYRATTGAFTAINWDTAADAAGNSGYTVTRANVILTLNNRLIMMNVTDSLDGSVPWRIRHTRPNDYNRTHSTDLLDLDNTLSPIISGAVMSNNMFAAFKEDSVTLVQNQGVPILAPKLTFTPGILGPKAWTYMPNGIIFYVSQTGFHIFAGGLPQSIGEKNITSYFFSQLRDADRENVYCWTNWRTREVMIHYPDFTGEPGRVLVYNWQWDCWSEWDFPAWCGFYRYRGQTTPHIYYGSSAGVIKEGNGTTDNGALIETLLQTKSIPAAPTNQSSEFPDYLQVNAVKSDAVSQPSSTAMVGVGIADFGRDTLNFTSAAVTSVDGYAPFSDIPPVATRYAAIRVTNFASLSEMMVMWLGAGDE